MTGLTAKEVQERTQQGLDNYQVASSTRTVGQIVKENIFTYFNLIFTVLAVLLIVVGSFKELTFMLLVVANTCVGIFQEIRSKRTLDKLRFIKMPKAHAIRDGKEQEVPVEALVLGDAVVLRAGNQIPADAKVLSGSIQVNESLLTGEADEINKLQGDSLLSGSFVVSGECVAELTAVGADSYISKLTIEATKNKKSEESEMILSLDRIVKAIGVIVIPVGVIMVAQQMLALEGFFKDSVIAMVAAVLGMIPEGLYMTASIAMVVSTLRLAKRDVLVQNMRCIETLARVDILLVDKTGTITESTMKVDGFTPIDIERRDEIEALIGDTVYEQTADNATMIALKEFFTKRSGRDAISVCQFSSKYKYSGVCFPGENYVIGAPEYVLREAMGEYEDYIREQSELGYRVLAFARIEEDPRGQALTSRAKLLALIYLMNPVRKTAPATFRFFADNDVEVKVISGDNPLTVSNVAMAAGIPNGDHYVDARQLLNDRAIYDAIQRYTVFGRVSPEQKQKFVKALQQQGKTVGMTGDGVNDILALRDADCSVAMASGSEAASNAAQLVLLDSDFSKMPSVVSEGRRVVNNIQKAASLYLTKNIFSLLLAMFSMINFLSYPLRPAQITLISAFTIGVPSFLLSLEPNTNKIRGRFMSNVLKMAAPAGITMFLSVSMMVVFGKVFSIDADCISTSCTMLVALVGFLYLFKVAVPLNKWHVGMIIALIIGMMYCVFFMPELFGINSITLEAAMLLAVFLIATEGLFRYIHKITGGIAHVNSGRISKKEQRRIKRRERYRGRGRGEGEEE